MAYWSTSKCMNDTWCMWKCMVTCERQVTMYGDAQEACGGM